ncbi:MAG: ABC transporter ATP-binding protein [Phycisphaerae bacterium]
MSSDLAMSVRGLGKKYEIVHKGMQHATLAEQVLEQMKNPFKRAERESFWALKDVSFDVKKGDVVGIIGKNGAGKSTLLKILSQIAEPTEGEIDLYGQVGSLLEVGTGFHPELTGRENVFLNGAILGMRRKDIQRQFDAIVDFAGVEKFLDTPVKRYSSGMYVRLAFAVAAHLNPEILIVDEVLAVGDAEFQRKCIGKMQDVSQGQGRTVLFVSHNMAAVRQLCTSAIYLKSGQIVKQGETEEVLDLYNATRERAYVTREANAHGLSFIDLELRDTVTGARTEAPVFNRDYEMISHVRVREPLKHAALHLRVYDDQGTKVTSIGSVEEGLGPITMEGDVRIKFTMPRLGLYPGRYTVALEVDRPNDPTRYLQIEDALVFDVQPAVINDAMWAYEKAHGVGRIVGEAEVLEGDGRGSAEGAMLRAG